MVKTLFGPATQAEVELTYGRFDFQERPMNKGERFIWIAVSGLDPLGRFWLWEGIKALEDTPANRALVVAASETAGIPATEPADKGSPRHGQPGDAGGSRSRNRAGDPGRRRQDCQRAT